MNPVILIPTMFGARRKRSRFNPTTVYDHPNTNPLRAAELDRLLDSLTRTNDVGVIMVLVSADLSVRTQAVATVEQVVNKYPQLKTIVIAESESQLMHQRLEQLGCGELTKEIGLEGYAAIRNLGLVAANVLDFDSVIFLDDDEVIDDPDFMHKAVYGLGKLTRRGVPILAKSGYYYNSEGTYLSLSQDKWYNRFWQQGKAFNQWIEAAMHGPRLSRSNHVCGGCLALHREAYRRLAFDPWIPRGEDLDYMLNLRMYGSDIWFDNKWALLHLPPATANEGERFCMDVYRWLYERRKIEFSRSQIDLMQISPSSLEPYPGPFLQPGINRRIRITAFLRSLARPDRKAYRAATRAVKNEAAAYADVNYAKYFEFQYIWPELMHRTAGDKILSAALLQSVQLRRDELGLVEQPVPETSLDPGATGEIRMNIAD